jgi:hypothetical protein
MKASSIQRIDEFCDALWLEDGLSRNTLDSYRRDLKQFAAWLAEKNGCDLLAAAQPMIQDYLAHKFRAKARASTAARSPAPPAGHSLPAQLRYLPAGLVGFLSPNLSMREGTGRVRAMAVPKVAPSAPS